MTSTNVPVLSLLKSCQGAPLSRRPNQSTGVPGRALNPALDARWLDCLRGAERRLDATANASLLPSVVNQNAEDEQDAGDDQTELEVAYRHCGGPADDARRRPDLANIISKIIPPRSIDNA